MLDELKKPWRTFRNAKAGQRFEKLHDARSESPPPIVFYAIGAVLLAGGVVAALHPGPGLLLIAFGGALIARQSAWLARRLDRLELRLRRLGRKARTGWRRSPVAVRGALVTAAAIVAAGAGYAGYLLLFAD